MKKIFFGLAALFFISKNFAQETRGIFVFKVPNSNKALAISSEKNSPEKSVNLKISPQTVTLNDVCTTCKSQQWSVYGGNIINISSGKYLTYNSVTKQLVLQSAQPQLAGWSVVKQSNGKVKVELYRTGCLYPSNIQTKTNTPPSIGYPCTTPYDFCDAIGWDLYEIESEITIPKYDFGTLCPSVLINGDREFNGNGPQISGTVSLTLANNNTELRATVQFEAIETGGDVSRTKQTWEKIIYTAPGGKKIASIIGSNLPSTFFFTSVKAGFVADRLVKGDVVHTNFPRARTNDEPITVSGNVVYKIEIIGDTAGDDISTDTNCNDDTRIDKLILNSVGLRIVNL